MAEQLSIEDLADFSLATIMARKDVPAKAIGKALGVEVPLGPRWSTVNGVTLIGTGPNTWLAQRDGVQPFWVDDLRERLAGLASVSDQSSAYRLWRLSGPGARTLLQRGVAIDFHQDSFGTGTAATSAVAHIGIVARQIDDTPTFELACSRSYAGSLSHWLDQAAAAL